MSILTKWILYYRILQLQSIIYKRYNSGFGALACMIQIVMFNVVHYHNNDAEYSMLVIHAQKTITKSSNNRDFNMQCLRRATRQTHSDEISNWLTMNCSIDFEIRIAWTKCRLNIVTAWRATINQLEKRYRNLRYLWDHGVTPHVCSCRITRIAPRVSNPVAMK